MLDALFRETVTLRRLAVGTRQTDGAAGYEIVVDDAEVPVQIRCRIERRRRRLITKEGVELEGDATMVLKRPASIEISEEDVVVDRNGQAWKILRKESSDSFFGAGEYFRLDLQETTIEVPANDGEGD
jgi:hypothetical protein